jgi:putative sigma-54 modulation protein
MDIILSSRNIEVSSALRQATIEKIGRLSRFLDMERAEVHFAEERNPRIEAREICEVTLQGQGHYVRAKVAALDPFAAVDLAVEKLEHQLLKLKTRLVSRHQGKAHAGKVAAGATVRTSEAVEGEAPADELESLESTSAVPSTPGSPDGRVVKTKRFRMKPMSLDEAVLQLDLLGHEFFVFVEAETGDTAVVYRREDGDVGLIEVER